MARSNWNVLSEYFPFSLSILVSPRSQYRRGSNELPTSTYLDMPTGMSWMVHLQSGLESIRFSRSWQSSSSFGLSASELGSSMAGLQVDGFACVGSSMAGLQVDALACAGISAAGLPVDVSTFVEVSASRIRDGVSASAVG